MLLIHFLLGFILDEKKIIEVEFRIILKVCELELYWKGYLLGFLGFNLWDLMY